MTPERTAELVTLIKAMPHTIRTALHTRVQKEMTAAFTANNGQPLTEEAVDEIKDRLITEAASGKTAEELNFLDAVEQATAKMVIQSKAKEAAAAYLRAEDKQAPPAVVSLVELLAMPDEDTAWRVGGAWSIGGRIILAGPYKGGKSTIIGNLVRCLADGTDFLGRFPIEPVKGKILLIDNELDERTGRRWFRDQGIQNPAAVQVIYLRGKTATFNILDPQVRAEWVQACLGAEIIIFDCLRPVLDALGLSEDKDAGRFLVAFDAFLDEVGASEGMIVHHHGHGGERSRGDSRILDWPDATWKLIRTDIDDPTSPRYFSAFGRDVDIQEVELGYDQATWHLSISGGSRKDARIDTRLDDVLAFLANGPGTSKTGIKAAIPGDDKATARAVDKGVELGLIRTEQRQGRGGGFAYYLTQVNSGEPMLAGVLNSGNPGYTPGYLVSTSNTTTPNKNPPEKPRCKLHAEPFNGCYTCDLNKEVQTS